jgi:nucleoside 2-deoxyribosyltransferase
MATTYIYLSGGIRDLSDEEAFGWRKKAFEHYYRTNDDVHVLIPNRLEECPDITAEAAARWIVKRDKVGITMADIVLAFCPRPSWGTSMEIMYAYHLHKWIVTICDEEDPSPWLIAHSDVIVPTLEDAYREIGKIIESMKVLQG